MLGFPYWHEWLCSQLSWSASWELFNSLSYVDAKKMTMHFFFVESRMTLQPKHLMAKPIYNSLWTLRSSAEYSRIEVTYFFLNQGVSFLQNSSIPTSTTSEEWEREETLFRLIQPWNIASLLNVLQLQQMMWCALPGLVRKILLYRQIFGFF